jgi:hypothetical protein
MNAGVEAFGAIVCGFRPEGSLAHLAVLVAFVLLAWWVSPRLRRSAHRP